MPGRSRGLVVALWVATVAAAFAVGRVTTPPQTPLPPDDLASSIRHALGEGELLGRLQHTASLLERLGPEALPEVAALYERMLPLIGASELRPLFAAWARFDPTGALDHALAWPLREKQEQRVIGVRTAMEVWARLDPGAAGPAAEQIAAQYPRLRQELWDGLARGWVHSGRGQEGLAAFLADVRPKRQRDGAVGTAVDELVRSGGAEPALGWADSVLRDEAYDREFTRSVFEAAARSAARWDPERTARWAMEHAEAGYAEEGPLIVVEHWALLDGAAAMAWLGAYPAGEPREQGVREAFRQWSRAHPADAESWLESESQPAFRDPALEVHVERLAGSRPEDALGWCERIEDQDPQLECLESAARSWYGRDAVAAEAWLQQSPLGEEARRRARRAPLERARGNQALDARRPRPQRGPR